MNMPKLTEEVLNELETDEYDVLEDIQPEDFVFVITSTGQLKGISFPEEMQDQDEVDINVEEIINFLVKKVDETRPANATLH
jgi:hypothetical protein